MADPERKLQVCLLPSSETDKVLETKIATFLGKEAAAYRQKYNLPLADLKIAQQIVAECFFSQFHQELARSGEIPRSSRRWKQLLSWGLDEREELFGLTLAALTELKSDNNAQKLAIDHDLMTETQHEFNNRHRLLTHPHIHELLEKVTVRKRIVPRLAEAVIFRAIGGKTAQDMDRAREHIRTLRMQSLVLHGLMASGLVAATLGQRVDPLYFPDESIALLEQIAHDSTAASVIPLVAGRWVDLYTMETKRDSSAAEGQAVDVGTESRALSTHVITPIFGLTPEDRNAAIELLSDCGRQVLSRVRLWSKSTARTNRAKSESRYQRTKYEILGILPLELFIPEVHIIYARERLAEAKATGAHHIWEQGVQISNFIIPRREMLEQALKILQSIQVGQTRPEIRTAVAKFEEALRAWHHFQDLTSDAGKLPLLHAKLDRLRAKAGNIGDLALGHEIGTLKSKVQRYRVQLAAYDQALSQLEADRQMIAGLATISQLDELTYHRLQLYLERKKLRSRLEQLEASISGHAKVMEYPGWVHLVDPSIHRELTHLLKVTLRLRYFQNLAKQSDQRDEETLYGLFENPKKIFQFLDDWIDAYKRSTRFPRKHILIKELEVLMQRYRRNGIDWDEIQSQVLEGIEVHIKQLERMQKLLTEKQQLTRRLGQVEAQIASATSTSTSTSEAIAPELAEAQEIARMANQIMLRILPDNLYNPDPANLAEARSLLEIYDRIKLLHLRINFVFPVPGERATVFEKQRQKHRYHQLLLEFLVALENSVNNPLIPWNMSYQMQLTWFMSALKRRINLIDAGHHYEEVQKNYQNAQRELAEAKRRLKAAKYREEQIKTQAQIAMLESRKRQAQEQLLSALGALDLVIDASES